MSHGTVLPPLSSLSGINFPGKFSETNKAWLFEWCTQKKLKPTYSFESKGKYPKVKYICTLAIDGIEYRAISEARNKKDAQVNTSGVRELIFSPSFFLFSYSYCTGPNRTHLTHVTRLDALCMGFLQSNGHYEKNRRE